MQNHLAPILCLEESTNFWPFSVLESWQANCNGAELCWQEIEFIILHFYVFSSNFHFSTLFQHFGERYIKFIVTYCNTKCGNRNIWLLLIVSGKLTSDSNKLSDYKVWWFPFVLCGVIFWWPSRTILYPARRLCCQVLSNFQESSFTFFSLDLAITHFYWTNIQLTLTHWFSWSWKLWECFACFPKSFTMHSLFFLRSWF